MNMSRARTTIVIADDHAIFRDGLRRLLESEPGFAVIGECADGVEAVSVVTAARPDVLLLDIAMPRGGGLEALASLGSSANTRVILLTAAIEPRDVLRAIKMGARGLVLKEAATRQLIEGIHRVMDGKFVMDADVTDDLAGAIQRHESKADRQYGLTTRELEIVAGVAAGESNRDIGNRLAISTQTVKHHLTNIFDKTGISTRLELALLAVREGLTATASPPPNGTKVP